MEARGVERRPGPRPPKRLAYSLGLLMLVSLLAAAQTSPPSPRDQFVDVAKRIDAFPPDRVYFVFPQTRTTDLAWTLRREDSPFLLGVSAKAGRRGVPGLTEYRSLMHANHPVAFLIALLKDPDPKIRTLAAAALVANGDPRLQRYLGPLLDDQSRTFDQLTELEMDIYVPPTSGPQTVATAVLRLVEKHNKEDFDRYWAIHGGREYCAGWFLWQFRNKEFQQLAKLHLRDVPSPDRELITLWLGRRDRDQPRWFSDAELLAAAKRLGRENVLAVLRHQPPTSDPEISLGEAYWDGSAPGYGGMIDFLLSHASELLDRTDSDTLIALEDAERGKRELNLPRYGELWHIAAASLRPKNAEAILIAAEERWPKSGKLQLARWDINGQAALPGVLQRFYSSPEAQNEIADAIYKSDYETEPSHPYKPLVETILRDERMVKINGQAMYSFASKVRDWKANYDRQFVDWVYAQPPDPHMNLAVPPRRTVVQVSGVASALVRDPRFLQADDQLLFVVQQCDLGWKRLSRQKSARLSQLILKIDLTKPGSTPEAALEEIRALLREDVGAK